MSEALTLVYIRRRLIRVLVYRVFDVLALSTGYSSHRPKWSCQQAYCNESPLLEADPNDPCSCPFRSIRMCLDSRLQALCLEWHHQIGLIETKDIPVVNQQLAQESVRIHSTTCSSPARSQAMASHRVHTASQSRSEVPNPTYQQS